MKSTVDQYFGSYRVLLARIALVSFREFQPITQTSSHKSCEQAVKMNVLHCVQAIILCCLVVPFNDV